MKKKEKCYCGYVKRQALPYSWDAANWCSNYDFVFLHKHLLCISG